MKEIEIKDIEQHFDGKIVNAMKVTPYAIIVVEDFQTAEEKLKAMSMDEGENRMKVGECDGDHVAYFIYREGEDNFKVDSYSYSQDAEVVFDFISNNIDDETRKQAENIMIEEVNNRNLERIDRITHSDLSVNQVIEMVEEHNILAHEMYEITTETIKESWSVPLPADR